MKTCTKMLMSAVMGMSLVGAAWGQTAGSSATGNQNQTGGSAPAAGGTGLTTPSDASTPTVSAPASDAMGNQDAMQTHDMSKMDMKANMDADMKMGAQLDKIAGMPDKAGDALFVLSNANGNLFEVEFAKLAQTKSQDAKVKDLAKMVEKDHSEANEKLKPIADKMGLEFPMALPSEKAKMLAIFSKLSPADFDTCYLLDNKAIHAKDITSFADHQKAVKDEDLRSYISMVLPKLKEHGMHIQMLAAEKGFPAMMADGGMMNGKMGDGKMMDHGNAGMGGSSKTGMTVGGSGANTDPTAPANNQNPSNR